MMCAQWWMIFALCYSWYVMYIVCGIQLASSQHPSSIVVSQVNAHGCLEFLGQKQRVGAYTEKPMTYIHGNFRIIKNGGGRLHRDGCFLRTHGTYVNIPSQGQYLWENVVDSERRYQFEAELDAPMDRKKQMTAIRDEIRGGGEGGGSRDSSPGYSPPCK